MKRCIWIAVCMMLLAAGCVETDESETAAKESVGQEEAAAASGTADTREDTSGMVMVKWTIYPYGITAEQEAEREELINQKLREDGYDFQLDLVFAEITPYKLLAQDYNASDMEYYFAAISDILENGETDIAFLGWDWSYRKEDVGTIIRQGNLLELSGLLDTPAGQTLYAAFSEAEWKSAETDGKIYCIPNQLSYTAAPYFAFNREYFSEEEIAGFDGSLSGLCTLIGTKDWSGVSMPVYWGLPLADLGGLDRYVMMQGAYVDVDTGTAYNPYETDFLNDIVKQLFYLHDHGYFGADDLGYFTSSEDLKRSLAAGDFGVLAGYEDSWSLEELRAQLIIYELPYRMVSNISVTTGICASSEHPEEAMELLSLLYTDAEYANLLLLGMEGTDYQLLDGVVCNMEGEKLAWLPFEMVLGIFDNVYPAEYDVFPIDRKARKAALYSSPLLLKNPYLGVQIDRQDFTEEMYALAELPDTCLRSAFQYGSAEQFLEAASAKMDGSGFAGMKEILETQLREWRELYGEE